jgi:hypothetical protein
MVLDGPKYRDRHVLQTLEVITIRTKTFVVGDYIEYVGRNRSEGPSAPPAKFQIVKLGMSDWTNRKLAFCRPVPQWPVTRELEFVMELTPDSMDKTWVFWLDEIKLVRPSFASEPVNQ